MAGKFHVLTTPAFDRQARKAVRNTQELTGVIEEILIALRSDPHNVTGRHTIKKLSGVPPEKGNGASGSATTAPGTTSRVATSFFIHSVTEKTPTDDGEDN